jgi:hypothetical protein
LGNWAVRENIKVSYRECRLLSGGTEKLWFDKECPNLLDQRMQAKLKWLQKQSQISGDNLKNVRHKTSITFRSKRREYLKEKNNDFETYSKKQKYRRSIEVKVSKVK